MNERLDKADRHILRLLQTSGRMTNADIAREVKLSPPSTLQRIRKLEQKGYIKGYTTLLDLEKLGYQIAVFAQVSLSLHQDEPIENFVDAVTAIPEVLECYHVSGEYDFLLKVVAKDMADYERVVREQLSRIRSVAKVHSCFVLRNNKLTSPLLA
jgi:Lrp/AsnC family leucine-responsive transcriptional regulator